LSTKFIGFSCKYTIIRYSDMAFSLGQRLRATRELLGMTIESRRMKDVQRKRDKLILLHNGLPKICDRPQSKSRNMRSPLIQILLKV